MWLHPNYWKVCCAAVQWVGGRYLVSPSSLPVRLPEYSLEGHTNAWLNLLLNALLLEGATGTAAPF